MTLVIAGVTGGLAPDDAFARSRAPQGPGYGLAIAKAVYASPNPQIAYGALSATDKAAFDSVERPVSDVQSATITAMHGRTQSTLAEGTQVTAAFNGCWAMQNSGSMKAAAGNTIGTYGESTEVCVGGGSVYYVAVYNVWDETSTPGWRIDKNPQTATFNAGWEGRGRAQFFFVLGIGGWDIQHSSPCLQLRLNADGYHYLSTSSCNLS